MGYTQEVKSPLVDRLKHAAVSSDTTEDKMLMLEAAEKFVLINEKLEMLERHLTSLYMNQCHQSTKKNGFLSSLFDKLF